MFETPKKCAKKRLKSADLVFYGKVIEIAGQAVKNKPDKNVEVPAEPDGETIIIDPPYEPLSGGVYKVKFAVEKAWKGNVSREITISAMSADGANCGIDLKVGESYLFFTNPSENDIWVGGCSVGTYYLPFLGKGYAPKAK